MRNLGASDKFFYYTSSNRTTFSIQIRLTLREPVRPDSLSAAVRQALKRYPEFAYRPVLQNNRLAAAENDAPVVVVPETRKVFHYGTTDTNGYLFYFIWEGNAFTLTYYHGLTDVLGMMEFLRCLLAFYAAETGFALTDEEAEECRGLFRQADRPVEELITDPYRVFGDAAVVPEFHYDNPGAFAIPGDYDAESEEEHSYRITLSASSFIRKTKELGVSFIPLLSSIISGAVYDAFDTEGKPVISMIPANMRPLLQADTAVNFSDALIIPYEEGDRSLPLTDRCRKFKAIMEQQKTENNFRHMAGSKAAAVDAFEADPTPLPDSARAKTQLPPPGGFRPITYAITYPGKISFSAGLDRMLEDVSGSMWVRGNSVFAYTFRDKMQVLIKCRTDDGIWAQSVHRAFSNLGFSAEMEDCGRVTCARMFPEEVESIG